MFCLDSPFLGVSREWGRTCGLVTAASTQRAFGVPFRVPVAVC